MTTAISGGLDGLVHKFANYGVGEWVVFSLLAFLTWLVIQAIANLYLHPLSAFPGPPVAAITGLYKAYIDIVAQSSFVHTLEKLHRQYGAIVGISEIHLSC